MNEAVYSGNLGMMEMFKFYQVANADEKRQMKALTNPDGKLKKQYEADVKRAWELLKKVTQAELVD